MAQPAVDPKSQAGFYTCLVCDDGQWRRGNKRVQHEDSKYHRGRISHYKPAQPTPAAIHNATRSVIATLAPQPQPYNVPLAPKSPQVPPANQFDYFDDSDTAYFEATEQEKAIQQLKDHLQRALMDEAEGESGSVISSDSDDSEHENEGFDGMDDRGPELPANDAEDLEGMRTQFLSDHTADLDSFCNAGVQDTEVGARYQRGMTKKATDPDWFPWGSKLVSRRPLRIQSRSLTKSYVGLCTRRPDAPSPVRLF